MVGTTCAPRNIPQVECNMWQKCNGLLLVQQTEKGADELNVVGLDAYGIEQYDFHRVNVSGETSVTCNDKDYKIASGMILDALRLGLRPKKNLKLIKSDQQPICDPHCFENLLKLDPRRYHTQNWVHYWPNSSQIKVSVVNIWRWQIKLSIQQLQNISLVSMADQIHSQVQESPQSAHTMTIMNLAHTMATGKRHYFQTLDIIIKWEMVSLKFTLQRLVFNKSRFPIGWPVSFLWKP